jgi:ketosteroid isomerase-like protein
MQVMDSEALVFEANRRFYDALSHLDQEAMDEMWLHEEWVVCVHPGWQMLRGWDAVRESWRRIFSGEVFYHIELDQMAVHIHGETAVVTCVERIAAIDEKESIISLATSTNLFVASPTGWKLILHHASPLPGNIQAPPAPQVH